MRRLPHWLQNCLHWVRARVFDTYAVKSYSMEGEDLILRRMFGEGSRGFYVDVGAHHPRRFSNTHRFYKRGWRGINIEPNPDAAREFRNNRRRDINLQCGVGNDAGQIVYYRFNESALNTFDRGLAESRIADTPYELTDTIQVPIERLESLLRQHLPPNQEIDFLSIDVEGYDLHVLRSNDWRRFRPKCVLVESLDTAIEDDLRGETFLFMKSQGYELFAKTFSTLIFRRRINVLSDADHARTGQ